MKRNLIAFVLIAMGFFALYALTAQRGLGWGDSGEFQYRVLHCTGVLSGCDSFATAHPLYVALAKAVCRTPFHITLLSAFFGALAVAGFHLCSRNLGMTVAFGLAHAMWWMSCVAEVYTMSLAFMAFETFFLLQYLRKRTFGWLVALVFLNGLHCTLHNLALLSLGVYAAVLLLRRREVGFAAWTVETLAAIGAWMAGASFWLHAALTRGVADVLVGGYGKQALGFLPANTTVTAFNLALSAMSFFAPLAVWWWSRHPRKGHPPVGAGPSLGWPVTALLVLHFVFFVRYFIVSQFTFVLPSVFFAYLLASRFALGRERAIPLAVLQVLIPLMACQLLQMVPVPSWRSGHKYRNEATYFALPWKFNDDSADRCAAEVEGPWKGYWDCSGKEKGL